MRDILVLGSALWLAGCGGSSVDAGVRGGAGAATTSEDGPLESAITSGAAGRGVTATSAGGGGTMSSSEEEGGSALGGTAAAGAAGEGAGGQDSGGGADNPSVCPSSPHPTDWRCNDESAVCQFEDSDSAAETCRTTMACVSGFWSRTRVCATEQPCPSEQPVEGEPCDHEGLACSYGTHEMGGTGCYRDSGSREPLFSTCYDDGYCCADATGCSGSWSCSSGFWQIAEAWGCIA